MGLEDLPQPIRELILKSVNNDNYEPIPNSYSLTEVLGCVRQSHYKKLNPKPFSLKSAYSLYRGKLFDSQWTPLFKRSQVRSTHKVKNIPVTIVGKFDFIYEDCVYDLKTHKNLYFVKEPSKDYVKQVRFYAYTNSIPKAALLYVDMGDCKLFNVEVGDCTELIAELEYKATQLYTSLKNNVAPDKPCFSKDDKWHCNYCDYCGICNGDENGTK